MRTIGRTGGLAGKIGSVVRRPAVPVSLTQTQEGRYRPDPGQRFPVGDRARLEGKVRRKGQSTSKGQG
jgi:hypothetical protein